MNWSPLSRLDDIPDPILQRRARDLVSRLTWPKGMKPYPYQEVGIAFAVTRGGRALIADDPGAGKSLQAISAMRLLARRGLVICPKGVLHNWADEIQLWGDRQFRPYVIERGDQAIPRPRAGLVLVCTWDMARRRAGILRKWASPFVILDEAHYAKNDESLRTRAVRGITESAPGVLLLSGTPVENRLSELHNLLHILDAERFPAGESFGQDFDPAITHPFMIRRLKQQILKEIPPKVRQYEEVTLTGEARATYDHVIENARQIAQENKRKRVFAQAAKRVRQGKWEQDKAWRWVQMQLHKGITQHDALLAVNYARQVVGMCKIAPALTRIRHHLSHSSNPLVVFAEHRKVIKGLSLVLKKAGIRHTRLDGSVGGKARHARVRAFQAGRIPVILCSQAVREGITLTRASDMLFLERWWVPTREEQAEDRIHRIGQKRRVQITYLHAADTIDQQIHARVQKKRKRIQDSVGINEWEEYEEDAEGTHRFQRRLVHAMFGTLGTEISVTRDDFDDFCKKTR